MSPRKFLKYKMFVIRLTWFDIYFQCTTANKKPVKYDPNDLRLVAWQGKVGVGPLGQKTKPS